MAEALVSCETGDDDTGGGVDLGGTAGFDTDDDDELDESLLDADREGPSSAATKADRSTKDLNSYFAKEIENMLGRFKMMQCHAPRMYFSNSLSLSESIMFVGGGFRDSCGL